jgi:hypothetical protein
MRSVRKKLKLKCEHCGKQVFKTRDAALLSVCTLLRKHCAQSLRVYECPRVRGRWHLTHKPERARV